MTINTNFKLLGKLNREYLMISAMIEIYCSHHHYEKCKKVNLCEDCEFFKSYVKQRLDRYPYGITSRHVDSVLFIATKLNKRSNHKQLCVI